MPDLSTTFGSREVDPGERETLIRSVFQRVAPRYDLMNDLMSFGIHRLWKRFLAREVAASPGQVIVDLAGGTGDVAARVAGWDRTVLVCDPSVEMMQVGRYRRLPGVRWLAGVGESIPLRDDSVDTLTIAFGIRNVTFIDRALAEIARVLRPGGRMLCLEFSRPWAPIRPFYQLFSATVIPRLGAWVSRNPDAYRYLVESIQRFPDQEEMKSLMESAGFTSVRYRNLSCGIACLHTGTVTGGSRT
ncbi:MAG: class I SAM-dependent methyltransferase [Gammaproteobacteria bacterium]|jgi:demethylmenaquinone methyltransferase/2-methoxy-6-polyprenyl-1,4-benzoquinol methylase